MDAGHGTDMITMLYDKELIVKRKVCLQYVRKGLRLGYVRNRKVFI